ncbi:MAG TPA: thiamine-phosphate kinase [Caulobacteraceae bacterium]|nr:thiamine-phosphate kinase [Caulobacteraceae bacterium]
MTSGPERPAEFETIAELFRPLTGGAPEARGLLDDAAVLPSRPGQDLVITKDAIVEGVHFLPDDPLDLVARKLLRTNLSDLAAKGAEPYGYFLAVSWSGRCGLDERAAFARGLAEDQARFGIVLLGGDTTSTPGPLTASVTALGWAPHGRTPSRAGARPGDLVLVSGAIGDGYLGLKAARGELRGLEPERVAALARRYRLPEPRGVLARAVRDHASASADVSDGLVADLGHICAASGVGAELQLEHLPLSAAAKAWLDHRADPVASLADLATGGDDYEIVCTARPEHAEALIRAGDKAGVPFAVLGPVTRGEGVRVTHAGAPVAIARPGWRHP